MHAAAGAIERERARCGLSVTIGSHLAAVNAATARVVELIAEGIELEQPTAEGCRSAEHWVAARCGVSTSRAYRLVRIARRLPAFPKVAAQFRAGQLTEDHVDVICTHAHPSLDFQLSGAGGWSIGQLRRTIALSSPPPPLPDDGDDDEPDDGAERDGSDDPARRPDVVALGWGDDGRLRGRIDVGAELGSLLQQALQSGRNALYRSRNGADADDDSKLAAVSGADALGAVVRAALDGLDPSTARGGPASGRHQVLVHVDADHPERSRLHLGPLLPRSVRQELLCDAELRLVLRRNGRSVRVGRKQRVADRILRALIEDRDGGCRVPGCGRTAYLHIHHLWHWEDGGPTDPDNLVALCTEHHRMVHAGTLKLLGNPDSTDPRDELVVLRGDGRPLPRPEPGLPAPVPDGLRPYHGPERGRFRYDELSSPLWS